MLDCDNTLNLSEFTLFKICNIVICSNIGKRMLLKKTKALLSLQQFTEEKFGQAEKTELDAHLDNLLTRAETTKHWTEKILKQTEVLLQPNPSKIHSVLRWFVSVNIWI